MIYLIQYKEFLPKKRTCYFITEVQFRMDKDFLNHPLFLDNIFRSEIKLSEESSVKLYFLTIVLTERRAYKKKGYKGE